jgi:hypothetical protein
MQTGQSIAVLGFKTPATNLFTDAVESPPSFSWGGVDVDTPDLFFGGYRVAAPLLSDDRKVGNEIN